MSDFYRVNSGLPFKTQLAQLNEMILKLAGKTDQGKFDVNDINALYSDLGSGYVHKYLRNQGIGNTVSTYSGWAHHKAESGYSIWKYQPTDYSYDDLNLVYFNNITLENTGEATAATSQLDTILDYNGSTYTDVTTDISAEGADEVTVLEDTDEYLYIGDAATFSGISFEFHTRGSNYTLAVEYWNGSAWTELTGITNDLIDGTSGFLSNGAITFTAPGDWAATTVNSVSRYWIRLSTTTAPITAAQVYYLTSGDSIEGLLSLSSTEIINQTWKFCTYSGYIYVTIPNSGATAYEGDTFITSTSSVVNLKNFFIYNNEFTADYLNSNWS